MHALLHVNNGSLVCPPLKWKISSPITLFTVKLIFLEETLGLLNI